MLSLLLSHAWPHMLRRSIFYLLLLLFFLFSDVYRWVGCHRPSLVRTKVHNSLLMLEKEMWYIQWNCYVLGSNLAGDLCCITFQCLPTPVVPNQRYSRVTSAVLILEQLNSLEKVEIAQNSTHFCLIVK